MYSIYKIIQSIISKEMHHLFMHAHTPTHNLWLWPKRPPLAFSVAETSMVEMSRPKRHRPKCPTFIRFMWRLKKQWVTTMCID